MEGAIIPTFPLKSKAMQKIPPAVSGKKKLRKVRIAGLLKKDCCVLFAFLAKKKTRVPKANVNTNIAISINGGAMATHEGAEYSPGIYFTADITRKAANAPNNA